MYMHIYIYIHIYVHLNQKFNAVSVTVTEAAYQCTRFLKNLCLKPKHPRD